MTIDGMEKSKIGLAASAAAAVGVSIGGGLWVMPVVASSLAGPNIIAVALLVSIPLFLSFPAYFTLVKIWPISGAHYYYPARFLLPENKKISQLIGWISVWTMAALGGIVTIQFMLVAGAEFIHGLVPNLGIPEIVILFITLSFIIVWFGIRAVGIAEIILSAILLTALTVILIPGLGHIQRDNLTTSSASIGSTIATFAMLYAVASASFYIIDLSGAVENAEVTIERSIIIAVVTNMTAALLIGIISVGVVPHTELVGETLMFVSQQYLPSEFMVLVGAGALLAGVTSVITLTAVYSRYISVTTEEGILPNMLNRENKFGEPMFILGALYIISVAGVLADVPIDMLASAVSLSLLLTFTLVLMVGVRLPTQFPEVFEKEILEDSQLLQPVIVRWASGIAVAVNIISFIYLSLETPSAFLSILVVILAGVLVYIVSHYVGDTVDTNETGIGSD